MTNIMIVDDELFIRSAMRNLIDWESHGYSIVSDVENGKKALEELERTADIDIVFLDIAMPVMNGIEFLQILSQREKAPSVIVLSAFDDFDNVRTAFRYGATNYLLKTEIEEHRLLTELEKVSRSIPELSQKKMQTSKPEVSTTSRNKREREMQLVLIEDILLARHPDKAIKLLEDSGFEIEFPLRIALFWFPPDIADSKIFALIDHQALKYARDNSCSHYQRISQERAVFLITETTQNPRENAHLIAADFQELLRISYNIRPDFALSDICEHLDDLHEIFSSTQNLREGQSRAVVRAKKYIQKHFARSDISLAEVSNSVEVSKSHLSSLFSKESGSTFSDYLTRTRVEASKTLLLESNYRIYEISEMVGYPNVEHFSRIFKKVTGISPGKYIDNRNIDQ